MKTIRFLPLSAYPHAAPIVAQWIYDEWEHQANVPYARVYAEVMGWTTNNAVPMAIIGLVGDTPVSLISLIEDDGLMPEHNGLHTRTPWIANFYCKPDMRHKKHMWALVRRLMWEAQTMGIEHVFFWRAAGHSPLRHWGAEVLGVGIAYGQPVSVSSINVGQFAKYIDSISID